MKFRKRPVIIDAVQFTGQSADSIASELGVGRELFDQVENEKSMSIIMVFTLEGNMLTRPGDWIVRGVEGEVYPVKDSIFRATYESVE